MAVIRAAQAGDGAALADLWNPWIAQTTVTFNPLEKTAGDLEAMIAARPGFFVATEAGGISGFACYGAFRAGPGYARTMEHTVVLSPAAQGQGTGRALMGALCDHAARAGVHVMVGAISAENAPALAFHRALGFAPSGVIPGAGFKFGRHIDLVLMHKILTGQAA